MVKYLLVIVLVILVFSSRSQHDTIFTSKKTRIVCKILEINEAELKYKLADNLQGPMYVMERTAAIKYVLSTGFSEVLNKQEPVSGKSKKDEDYVKPDYAKVTNFNGVALKFQPFGISFDHLALSLEKVLNKELNFEIESGYINSAINPTHNAFTNRFNVSYSGAYVKPGLKVCFSRDHASLEKNNFHPFQGGYFRLDLAYSDITYRGLTRVANTFTNGNNNTPITVRTDLHTSAFGMFFNFGYQLIIAHEFVLDWYAGMGYTGQRYEYSNPDYLNAYGSGFFTRDDISSFNYYHGFFRAPYIGLSFATAFKIGYVISGEKKKFKN